jgi:uncharacterized membrane protein YqiK
MAEADAIKARADALAENQDAVIGQQLAEHWPQIVEAAAKPFGDIISSSFSTAHLVCRKRSPRR